MPDAIPDVLDVEHPPGAKSRDCIGNVERVIAAHGGSAQYGWQLWETLPGLMLEAEFHAVWVDPDGEYRDVTPKGLPFDKSLFLADPELTYQGRQIDNVRVPLRDDPLINEYIAIAEQYFDATNRGSLADHHGDITPLLNNAQKAEIRSIRKRQVELSGMILTKYYIRPQHPSS